MLRQALQWIPHASCMLVALTWNGRVKCSGPKPERPRVLDLDQSYPHGRKVRCGHGNPQLSKRPSCRGPPVVLQLLRWEAAANLASGTFLQDLNQRRSLWIGWNVPLPGLPRLSNSCSLLTIVVGIFPPRPGFSSPPLGLNGRGHASL